MTDRGSSPTQREVLEEGSENRVPYAKGYGDLVENVLSFLTFYGSEGPADPDNPIFSPEVIAWATANLMDLECALIDIQDATGRS